MLGTDEGLKHADQAPVLLLFRKYLKNDLPYLFRSRRNSVFQFTNKKKEMDKICWINLIT